jgi:hypothetical protein
MCARPLQIIATFVGCLLLCGQHGASAGPFRTIQLTNSSSDNTNPQVDIWGDVTWEASTDIFLWWNKNSQLNRLCNDGWPDARPMINDSM